MTTHPEVELLSTYLDRELTRREKRRVEGHLEQCDDCRQRLTSLQKVIGNLQAMERLAPPAHLGAHLHRLTSVQSSRPTLIQRLEQGASRFNVQPSIAPIFAIVVALILIVYMLSWGLHRQATGRIPVHLEPLETVVENPVNSPSWLIIGAKRFHLVDGLWIEEGLDRDAVAEPIPPSDPRVQAWFLRFPDLRQLEGLGGPVRLRLGSQVVEIQFDEP